MSERTLYGGDLSVADITRVDWATFRSSVERPRASETRQALGYQWVIDVSSQQPSHLTSAPVDLARVFLETLDVHWRHC